MYADLRTQEWVFGSDVTAPAKLVLFALIYHANKDTGLAFPSQETIAAKTSLTRVAVGKMLKTLASKGLIERVKRNGRSVTYRIAVTDCNKAQDMQTRLTSDDNVVDIRCKRRLHQMITTFTSDDNDVYTNQSINQRQSTNPPTKKENRPPAIPPTVFKQGGVEEGDVIVGDDGRERMFGEFWAAYPDRCPRKIDYDRCSRKHAEILAAS